MVEQPNPYERPGGVVTPSLLPYPVTFDNRYDREEWPGVIEDPGHYITAGLEEQALPGPADQMTEIDPAYTVLIRGRSSRFPSLMVAEFGSGRLLILADTSSLKSLRPFGNAVYRRMIEWLLGS